MNGTDRILRVNVVAQLMGVKRGCLYWHAQRGLWPPPIKVGAWASGWPESEVQLLQAARLGGATDDKMRGLVTRILADRHVKAEVAIHGAEKSPFGRVQADKAPAIK